MMILLIMKCEVCVALNNSWHTRFNFLLGEFVHVSLIIFLFFRKYQQTVIASSCLLFFIPDDQSVFLT